MVHQQCVALNNTSNIAHCSYAMERTGKPLGCQIQRRNGLECLIVRGVLNYALDRAAIDGHP
jgi:hypothetical protein